MRMIPVGTSVQGGKVINIALPRFHRVLSHTCYPIGSIRNAHTVPVNGHAKCEMIDERDHHLIALSDPQCRPRSRAVKGPGRHHNAWAKCELCGLCGQCEGVYV